MQSWVVAGAFWLAVSTLLLALRRHAGPMPGSVARGVLLYEVASPLAFSALGRAASQLAELEAVHTVVVDLRAASEPDESSLVALDSAVRALLERGLTVVLASGSPSVPRTMARLGTPFTDGRVTICATRSQALALVRACTAPARREPARSPAR
ncbi:MAG TPA: sodium-independent anion transporter [Planctomycetota bacterium]|nr:sodium-independent anion transporter [Planctomycetota bacterium]